MMLLCRLIFNIPCINLRYSFLRRNYFWYLQYLIYGVFIGTGLSEDMQYLQTVKSFALRKILTFYETSENSRDLIKRHKLQRNSA